MTTAPGPFLSSARSRWAIGALVVLLTTSSASANAGTPMIWGSMLHMFFGNAIIGVVEGLLLAWLFRVPKTRAMVMLIVANYVSAWLGAFVLGRLGQMPDITIENIRGWFAAFVGIAFALTLVIEYPLVWFVLRKQVRAWRRALVATVAVNLVSYAALGGWYWLFSSPSMITSLQVVPAGTLRPPGGGEIYFLTPDGRAIERSDLSGKVRGKTEVAQAANGLDHLFARPEAGGKFALYLYRWPKDGREAEETLIREDFARKAPVNPERGEARNASTSKRLAVLGVASSLMEAPDWLYWGSSWASEGLHGVNRKDRRERHLAMEIPFFAWPVWSVTQLEGDFLVFQLGRDQICLLDPETRRISLIARGRGPIAVLPKSE